MAGTRRTESALDTLFADNTAGDISAQDGRDVITSVHPAKVVQTDTQANEPAAGQLAGDLFLPSDGFQIERYSGSAWAPWGPIYPFTKPVDGDFAWINQGSATVSTTKGGIVLELPGGDASNSFRLRKKAAPATPYTITIAYLVSGVPETSKYQIAGLAWRQSSDGKLVTCPYYALTTEVNVGIFKWSSPTNIAGAYVDLMATGLAGGHARLVWARCTDDGTDRKIYASADGQTWHLLHTVGRTDYLTADEVGFGMANLSSGTASLTLLSWKES